MPVLQKSLRNPLPACLVYLLVSHSKLESGELHALALAYVTPLAHLEGTRDAKTRGGGHIHPSHWPTAPTIYPQRQL